MNKKLLPGVKTPNLKLPLVGGGTYELRKENPGAFSMVVFYRGHHCPICKMYITKLAGLLRGYESVGFSVVAVSMNTQALAEQTAIQWGLGDLRIAHSLTIDDGKAWGLWLSQAMKDIEIDFFTEPGLFWIKPDGTLYLAEISNMPWARPDLEFLLSKVPFAIGNGYPPRGTYLG